MNPYDSARLIEARGMSILMPFLKERAYDGRVILTSKGRLARYLQEVVGDAMFNQDADTVWSVEVKIEAEDRFGKFFIETWSNKNLDSKANHAALGSNPGWAMKLKTDLLFYYFLKQDALYIIDFFELKRWAFGHEGHPPNLYRFPEKRQGKRAQANDTWGRCVPISVIQKEVGFRKVFPRQVDLFDPPQMDAAE